MGWKKNVLLVYLPKLEDQIHKSKHSVCFIHCCKHSSWHTVDVQEALLVEAANSARKGTHHFHAQSSDQSKSHGPAQWQGDRKCRLPGAWKESRGRYWRALVMSIMTTHWTSPSLWPTGIPHSTSLRWNGSSIQPTLPEPELCIFFSQRYITTIHPVCPSLKLGGYPLPFSLNKTGHKVFLILLP